MVSSGNYPEGLNIISPTQMAIHAIYDSNHRMPTRSCSIRPSSERIAPHNTIEPMTRTCQMVNQPLQARLYQNFVVDKKRTTRDNIYRFRPIQTNIPHVRNCWSYFSKLRCGIPLEISIMLIFVSKVGCVIVRIYNIYILCTIFNINSKCSRTPTSQSPH